MNRAVLWVALVITLPIKFVAFPIGSPCRLRRVFVLPWLFFSSTTSWSPRRFISRSTTTRCPPQGVRETAKTVLDTGDCVAMIGGMRKKRWIPEVTDPEAKPAIFHVLSRVVDRRFVFEREEREVFRMFMRMYENFSGCRVLSYCVMSNHFHI